MHFVYDPPKGEIPILYQDADILVVNKPEGLLSVPGKDPAHSDCVETRLKDKIPSALLVHRLDMDTSGLMLFAANPKAQRHLGLQFERRHISKRYEALVDGQVQQETGTIELPIIVDWPNRPLQKICHETGRAAQTDWKVLARTDLHTRLALFPKTGRSHQLRIHMRELGHPILGDRFYGDALTAPRLCLHAAGLTLRHPTGGTDSTFHSTVPF